MTDDDYFDHLICLSKNDDDDDDGDDDHVIHLSNIIEYSSIMVIR